MTAKNNPKPPTAPSKVAVTFVSILASMLVIGLTIGYIWLKFANQAPVNEKSQEQPLDVEPVEPNHNPDNKLVPPDQYTERTKKWLSEPQFAGAKVYNYDDPPTDLGQYLLTPFDEQQVITSNYDDGFCETQWSPIKRQHLKNSYAIVQDQTYRNYWRRLFAAYLPKITDEIENQELARTINQVFEDKFIETKKAYENGKYNLVFDNFEVGFLDDSSNSREMFWCFDYRADFVGDYLSIVYYQWSLAGDTHGGYGVENTYNFDLKTGELLSLQDLFNSEDDYITALNNAVHSQKDTIKDGGAASFDAREHKEAVWSLTDKGIVVYFSPYEIAAFAYGMIEAVIPYSAKIGRAHV